MLIKNKLPTLADVADHAGVSRSTVSLYLNGKLHRMGKSTQEKIARAIEAVGYTLDPIARSLSTGKTFTIGLAWDASNYEYYFEDIYFMFFAKKVAQYLSARNYSLMLVDPGDMKNKYKMTDGMIVKATEPIWGYVSEIGAIHENYPIVSLGKFRQESEIASVSVDDVEAGRGAIAFLSRAHRHIHVLSFPRGRIIGFDERVEGAIAGAQALGVQLTVDYGEMSEAYGNAVVSRLHQADALPDALFCLNDITAIGALKAAKDLGVAVPGKLSIMGVDDTPSVSYCLGLSTIRHPIGDLADAVCELIFDGIAHPEIRLTPRRMRTTLVERATTKPESPSREENAL
ncbi:LacI family DNA-binding transcriptional regulator [Rhizobium leguminosarum]|uniref:LacI family DNA-binding transcriptional regulator n=1 Tax=Rhizobium leguminosarum TaxID=384 RepID=UPI0021BBB870|nr:LacI family DNA-binding transcriptional regulator [Rhizobium leguminosarum]